MNDIDLRTKRKLKRRKENRRIILEVAEKLFVKKGYRGTAVDDIAENAQFSKATIYRYFENKLDIFTQIVMATIEQSQKDLTKIAKKNTSSEERLREFIQYILGYYQKKKNLARILFMERDLIKKFVEVERGGHFMHHFRKKKIPKNVDVMIDDIFNQLCKVIKQGISSGEFRKQDPKDACFLLGAIMRGFHFTGFNQVKKYSVEEATDLISNVFLNGIKKP
ncbi:MAG: TetR family transcriptional regulator [Candidatus Aminicenantes bacterium]|nr:TetR family transcriptional regulator [Candidatus Aminicenantes bacterium]